ncbi:MAG: hypothetical protein NTY76_01215 [Candidatus Omnitrophica bacterium]|nr:hypothetical protein [Candidatus Omnitrophota bacterium]
MRALRATMMIVSATLVALLYVHQQVELVKLSYSIELKEKTLKDVLDHNEGLGYNIDNLEAPNRLEEVLLAKKIEVAFPKRGHVVRLASSKYSGSDRRPYILKASKKHDIFAFFDFLTPKAEAQVSR